MLVRCSILIGCVAVCLLAGPAAEAATYTLFGSDITMHNGDAVRRVIPGSGTVTGPDSRLGSLMIPPRRFETTATTLQAFPQAPGFAQNASTFTERQTASHTFAVSGGPGGFEFCAPIGNPLNPNCNRAAGIQGSGRFRGFVNYDEGIDRFGGTFRLARKSQTVTSFRIATGPSQFAHQREIRGALPALAGGPATTRSADFVPTTFEPPTPDVLLANPRRADWAAGLPYASQYFQASPGVLTIGPQLGPMGSIQTAGPTNGFFPYAPLSSISTGFPWTTGQISHVGFNNLGVTATFTVTGGNYRGPDGQGNIVLVAGGLFQPRSADGGVSVYAEMKLGLVDTTLPEPSMGIGLATGFALLLGMAAHRPR